ncbi:MAG: hypothetical protein ABIH66_10035 [bacterium]
MRKLPNAFIFYCLEWFFLIVFPVCLAAFVFQVARLVQQRHFPVDKIVQKWLTRAYYFIHTLFLIALSFFVFHASPVAIVLIWVGWFIAVTISDRSDLFYSMFVRAFFILSVLFTASLCVSELTWIYGIIVSILAILRPDLTKNLPQPEFKRTVIKSILVVAISLNCFWFYFDRSGRGIERVEKQPGVSFIFSFKRDVAEGRNIGEYLRFVKEDCNSTAYYFGGMEFLWFVRKPNHILRYDKVTGRLFDTGWTAKTGHIVDMNCRENKLFVGEHKQRHVKVFKPGIWGKAVRTYNVVGCENVAVALLFDGTRLLVWNDLGKLAVYRTGDGEELGQFRVRGSFAAVRSDLRECIVCGGNNITVFSLHPGFPHIKLKNSFKIPKSTFTCGYSSNPNRLFLTDLFSKHVNVFDIEREKFHRKRLPYYCRNILVVRRGLVAVADYFGGHVMFLDENTLELLGTVRTGRRVRELYPSNDRRKIFFSNALGVGVIDLDEVLGGRFKET